MSQGASSGKTLDDALDGMRSANTQDAEAALKDPASHGIHLDGLPKNGKTLSSGFDEASVRFAQAELENMQDEYGNMLVHATVGGQPAYDRQGRPIMISPVVKLMDDDPFPNEEWPDHKEVVRGPTKIQHGGHVRMNTDGSFSFKPTSYIGKVVTAESKEALSNFLP